MRPSVLIVGAGPTGLTAAVELARLGIAADIIDKRPGPSQLSRAVGILRPSMQILAASGVTRQITSEAILFDGIAFHQGARRIARFPLNFDDKSQVWGLPQDRTEYFLREALRGYGGTVRYDSPLEALEQSDSGVTATINGKRQTFDYVIGADGVASAVRRAIGVGFPGYDLPQHWSIADVDSPGWRDPRLFQGFLLEGGNVCVVVPLATARFRVISSTADALAALPVPMNVIHVRRSGAFLIMVRQAERYQIGRVFLAGDAAHAHSPVGGRGMNLGIADAADLAGRIARGDTDGYHAARHPEGAQVLAFSERGRKVIQTQNPLLRRALPLLLHGASALPVLARFAMHRFVGA